MGLTLISASSLLGLLLLQGITGMFFELLISTYKHRRDQVSDSDWNVGRSALLDFFRNFMAARGYAVDSAIYMVLA